MPTKLRKLKITRVAVCPQGANPDADILLFKSADPVVDKADVTVGDVYTDTYAGTSRCTDPDCDDPDCPVHGPLVRARRKKKRVAKGPIGGMGMHSEPDGDEETPLDYATRGHQYDLWETLWQKWQCLCATYTEVCGDWDSDNVPNLPILERSIGQFQDDVHQLLVDCGVVEKVAPALAALHAVAKVGSPMADHRRKRLQDAIATLQQILTECTPEVIDRPGISAAAAAGLPGYMGTPALSKGAAAMAVRKNAESDKKHCADCDDPDCDNPAHDRVKDMEKQEETRLAEVQAALAKAQADLAEAQTQLTARDVMIVKMQQTPEEQEAEYLASLPEAVRKKHVADQEEMVALRKQLADAREEREQTVYLAKTADFRHFGMVAQPKHARILKAIDAMDEEDREELLRLIKANQEQARTAGLFTATGTEGRNGSTSLEGGSASDRLMALTTAYMDDKGVDFLKASEVIAKQHRDLYTEANRERRQASRVSSH
jgi:hypothetical protein